MIELAILTIIHIDKLTVYPSPNRLNPLYMSYDLLSEAKGWFLKSKISFKIGITSNYENIVFTVSPGKLQEFGPSLFHKNHKHTNPFSTLSRIKQVIQRTRDPDIYPRGIRSGLRSSY